MIHFWLLVLMFYIPFSASGLPALPPVNKPEGSGPYSPPSPPTSSPPTQPPSKSQKKPSPPTPVQQNTVSKPPKLKDKDPNLQTPNVGNKRANAEEGHSSQKVKKKKIEKSNEGVAKTLPKEVPILGQSDEKGKTKTPSTAAKKTDEVKERRKSSDVANEKLKVAKTGKDGKKEVGKDTKGKDLKEKGKKDKVKKDDKNSDEPKVQKLTVKRTSTDAWASTTKNPGNKDNVFDALLSEFGAEDSESEMEDLDDSVGAIGAKVVGHDKNANENVKVTSGKGKKIGKTKSPPSATPESLKMNGTKRKEAPR